MNSIRKILPVVASGMLVLVTAAPALAQDKMTLEEWQAQLDACNQREQAATAQISDLDSQIANLRSQIADVDRQIASARTDIQNLDQQISSTQNELNSAQTMLEQVRFPAEYTVVKGDCLWNIAKKDYIYNDPFKWPRIYEANKDKIKDPDLIYPKQVFKIIRP